MVDSLWISNEEDATRTSNNVSPSRILKGHPTQEKSQSYTKSDLPSCTNCQKRKVKCSKEIPCSNCIKRKEECIYETQKSQIILGIEREREVLLKGCDRCLQMMVANKKWTCDLMSPCYNCMKLGLDCKYGTYKKISPNNETGTNNAKSNNNLFLKKYILEEFINTGAENDIEFLEMLQENEMFVASRDDNNDDDIEVLQLFQDYSFWIMKKGFYNGIVVSNRGFIVQNSKYNGEIFDMNDFLTISFLTGHAIENLGFMFLGIFYDPIKSFTERPESFIDSAKDFNKIVTVDVLMDECVLRSIALLSIYYMDSETFYKLAEISSSKKLFFYKAHLDHLIEKLTKVSHFEDIRIIQILLVLSSTDLPLRYPKKYSTLMTICFDLVKTLNLDKMSSIINDAALLKYTFIQKNIYYKFVYFSYLYQNQLSSNHLTLIAERHTYDFRRMHFQDHEDDDGTRLSFEQLQYKVGLFFKELQDKEMIVHGLGLGKYYSNTKSKLNFFKTKNVNVLLESLSPINNSISTIGEALLVTIDYYFLNWKLIKYKFSNCEKLSLKNTMILVDEIFSACELIVESLIDCLNHDSIKYKFYKYPSIMNCVVETVTFHALYKIFNKSERNIRIYEKLVMIIHKFIELELIENEDELDGDIEGGDDFNFDFKPYFSKYVQLTRLLDRFNSIKSLFSKAEINNKDITENLPYVIMKEDVLSVKSNFEDRVCNIIPGMNTTVRNDLHSYKTIMDSPKKIEIITSFRENLYVILASFKDFI